MAKIDLKRTVNIEFIGSGLDKLEKSLDSIISKVEDKQGIAQANKLKSDILLMKKVLEEGSNEVSEEVFKNFQREFQNMFKAFDRVRRSIKPTVNIESNKELEQLEKEITELETRIENLKSERTSVRRNVSEGKTSSPSD
jgi:BMFP domain-containing protein YqiC